MTTFCHSKIFKSILCNKNDLGNFFLFFWIIFMTYYTISRICLTFFYEIPWVFRGKFSFYMNKILMVVETSNKMGCFVGFWNVHFRNQIIVWFFRKIKIILQKCIKKKFSITQHFKINTSIFWFILFSHIRHQSPRSMLTFISVR